MNKYENLIVWQKSHELTLSIYKVTKSFPESEIYSMTNQMRRSAYSIPTNIAEGAGLQSKKNFVRFLDIAKGSAFELDYQLKLSSDLGYINEETFKELQNETKVIQKMLYKLMKSYD